MAPPPYASPLGRVWYYGLRAICGLVLAFLVLPILAIVPLSFNATSFLSYPMPGLSLQWYAEVFAPYPWMFALQNSLIVALSATALATVLGTLAALGLTRSHLPWRSAIMGLMISPMVVPIVITGVGVYFFFAELGLTASYPGLILAHTALAAPFVVITVSATLHGFDANLMRAGASLGAPPLTVFFRVVLPLILPGVISGALFAFATSFDEVVVAIFLAGPQQRTLPLQMFDGIRENISPAIVAVATLLVLVSVLLMIAVELLRRRGERLRGLRP